MVCKFAGSCSLSEECSARGDYSQPPCATKTCGTQPTDVQQLIDEFDVINVDDAVIANADHKTSTSWERIKTKLFCKKKAVLNDRRGYEITGRNAR